MSFVVENGMGLPNANALATVAAVDDYHQLRGNLPWMALSDSQKQAAIVQATDYLEVNYSTSYLGTRRRTTQSLSWPRQNAIIEGQPLPFDQVPQRITYAVAELALRAANGPLIIDQGQRVIEEKVDVLMVKYAEFSDPTQRYPQVSRLILPLLKSGASIEGGLQNVTLNRR